ncbi:hypothetical protein [Caulobacter sp. NIBR1757]|uniref:hypothetical protein n=1 Tax=Caulobacter sp. NIBR1757 TaxID=3016000 RepID=UPI0022F121BF|nr:hypothetical protein [Caulobacter sp. NIBR1757]WGM41122.1 hypothetical protein AMEJIAPC_04070 [Caulobacter sp. NIBR1757]
MEDMEAFMRDKIARLRAEADALEKTLKEYLSVQARVAGAARRSGDHPRSGAFGVILEAIGKAGPNGMTLDEMIDAAKDEGYEVKRNTLRSQIWSAKEEGVLSQIEPGRYRVPLVPKPPPPPRERTAEEAFGVPQSGGFGGGSRAQPTGPREDFGADLDDEIPF